MNPELPAGRSTMRVPAMPANANSAGDIFGGWVMSQMDLAAGIHAAERAGGRVVTKAVREMAFELPVKIGDTVAVYTDIISVGRTSILLSVEAWAQRHLTRESVRVTRAEFIMVALDAEGRPTAVPTGG
ncbi:acyl-CoA thioesterase [Notoacmeibacter sp. MSK16QG-6]|uniref:acyl-CoA thioesterase n=1 Tax=Notoacmeibacter sp. MSK16QG-6 TaxID=2957982 RepID=UPI0020A03690|nr:acyl-CoA thioesterase [Notoacmeibacter sp. MSK16QG-6]MCP1199855.1 acyl-CoA thioesterase [Notoacmeibacter sp. MSK16QG-6]